VIVPKALLVGDVLGAAVRESAGHLRIELRACCECWEDTRGLPRTPECFC